MDKKRIFAIVMAGVTALLLVIGGLGWAINVMASTASPNGPLTTAFTYQGFLTAGGEPANEEYDFTFDLYPGENTGTLIDTVVLEDVPVAGGVFTVWLDYGPDIFDGNERWLEISIRPGGETGDYSTLVGRQALTPSPYALYAIKAGAVEWDGVQNHPAGLDDGDDDTTYSAGFGLDLDSTTFNVMTGTIQSRVSGGCAVGSTIRSINANGSVDCEKHDTRPVFNQQALDTNNTGWYTSITIGSDGFPIISYLDYINETLKVAHCDDIACGSSTNSTLDFAHMDGQTSIAIGSDGLPVISYFECASEDLKFAHCENLACTSAITKTLDSTAFPDAGSSIAIGRDGYPLISYGDYDSLNVAHCNDLLCASVDLNEAVMPATPFQNINSIAIGVDSFPIISYHNFSDDDLVVAHCNDHTCTSAITRTIDSTGFVGYYSSITIGSDVMPIISYEDNTNITLKVAHCNDITCSTTINRTLDSDGQVGLYSSITIGADGLPVISYYDYTNHNLKLAHCSDFACNSASIITVDTSTDVGVFTSITVGSDGMPIISYFDSSHGDLKVTHFTNVFCIKHWQRR